MTGYRLSPIRPGDTVDATFDGAVLSCRAGEPLAAALIANGVQTVARSFKYHRPRGIVGFGRAEPNALVQTRGGIDLATRISVTSGLEARAVNCWPSAAFDVASILSAFGSLMPAGFYYKTFRGPQGCLWPLFEPAIRALAGLGELPSANHPLECEKRFAHCDVLVIGGGVAGLAAARAASADPGARVWLLEDDETLGGAARDRPDALIEGFAAREWISRTQKVLEQHGVRILRRTAALGRYDGGLMTAVEEQIPGRIAKRLWKIRARAIVLATGSFERPLVFANNDRPGVMLLSSVLAYARRCAVACGRDVVVATNHDEAYDDALALVASGVRVSALVDIRPAADPVRATAVQAAGVKLHAGHAVIAAHGSPVRGLRIAPVAEPDRHRDLPCDVVAMAGGWTPAVHLHSHAGGRLEFNAENAAFVPTGPHDGAFSAGACNGRGCADDVVYDGHGAGVAAAGHAGLRAGAAPIVAAPSRRPTGLMAHWEMPRLRGGGKAFVDVAADVTADDVRLAVQEGYDGVELLKRYTTTGMALDQGRFGNMNAIDVLSRARDVVPSAAGTTTFRPPFVPVEFAALADPGGALLRPSRTTTLTAMHEAAGAVMYESGANWRRPGYYPIGGETLDQATRRECLAVRRGVGIYDSSPLGKFEIGGRDAATFLDFVYATRVSDLKPGRGRYALQLHEDGRLFDDGIVFRTAPDRFFATTTTGNADACLQRFEYCRQVLRPDLSVFIVPVTEQWADIVVCGPLARDVMVVAGTKLPATFPFMSIVDTKIGGQPVRIARAGFTGEMSYEIFLPARAAPDIWRRLLDAGAGHAIVPVGSEANHVLRVEKGFISVGHEGDGITDPDDLGLGFAVHADKPDFVGRQALLRNRADPLGRPQLVGLLSHDERFVLPEGALILRPDSARGRGHVTASCWSDALGRSLALALVEDGRAGIGSRVTVALAGGTAGALIVPPSFYDPSGGRQRG